MSAAAHSEASKSCAHSPALPGQEELREEIRPLHARFWRALDEEVEATREQDRSNAIAVGSGSQTPSTPTQYRFSPKADVQPFSAGDRVRCRLGAHETDGTVIESEEELVLDLDRDLGATTPEGEVRPDTAWMTQAIRDRIASTIQAAKRRERPDPPFHFDLALRALGERAPDSGTDEIPDPVMGGPPPLNPEQLEAIRRSLGSEVLHLWGPPGTGKSTTLARIAEAHHRVGRTVLVVATSNQAVDVITRALAERLHREDSSTPASLLRVGPGVTKQLPEEVRRIVRPKKMLRRAQRKRKNEVAALEDCIREARSRRWRLIDRLRDFFAAALNRLVPDSITRSIESPVRSLRRKREKLTETDLPTLDSLLDRARIITSTAHQALLNPSLSRSFDVVVIDEASMMAVPTTYLMAGRARSHVIVGGDFQQLPPVSTLSGRGRGAILSRDVFEHAGIPEAVEDEDLPESLVHLRKQYRMRPAICRTASRLFYGYRLQTAPMVKSRPSPDTPLGGALYCLDTNDLSPRVERVDGGSRRNRVHGQVVESLLDYLLLGPTGNPDPEAGPVGVLAPFVGQRRHIQNAIRGRYPAEQVPVSTIHGAQGDEHPVLILDLVDARGLPVSKYLRANRLMATGARLLNVAITRASDQLIIVADFRHLTSKGGRVVKRLLRSLRSRATMLSPERLLEGSRAVGT